MAENLCECIAVEHFSEHCLAVASYNSSKKCKDRKVLRPCRTQGVTLLTCSFHTAGHFSLIFEELVQLEYMAGGWNSTSVQDK